MRIVSANYFDRESSFRWLVREHGENPEAAGAFRSVVAIGVAFCPSTSFESGFGCTIVAQCRGVIASQEDVPAVPGEVRLKFNGVEFVDLKRNVVAGCASLRLCRDGSMYAVL